MEKTPQQRIVDTYFTLRGWDYRDPKIKGNYGRNVKFALKELLPAAEGSVEAVLQKMGEVKRWAEVAGLSWTLETVMKRWLEDNTPKVKTTGERTLHDGSKALWWGGRWVDAHDKNVTLDVQYYPELTK